MLYVSGYDKQKNLYSVTDTDDGAVDWLGRQELLNTAKALAKNGIKIDGVSGSSISVKNQVSRSNDPFSGVDWSGSLDKVAARVDPLDSLKPRIKKLLAVAERIRQVDKVAFESSEIVFETWSGGKHSTIWYTLNIEAGPSTRGGDDEYSLGFYSLHGRLVIGLGCRWTGGEGLTLYFYTDGNTCSQHSPYKDKVNYAKLEAEKKRFIQHFDRYERAFAEWFKKKYNS